jgi:hypothetical protein
MTSTQNELSEVCYYDQDILDCYMNDANYLSTSNDIIESEQEQEQEQEHLYPGLYKLIKQDVESYAEQFPEATIHVCTYQINKTGMAPFLQFILRKYDKLHTTKSDLLCFPSFKYKEGDYSTDMCELIENVICFSYRLKPDTYEYKGFINNGNDFYVFYEIDDSSINVHDLSRKNDLWLVLIDEIINHEQSCNFNIDQSVCSFFKNNIDFSYLLRLNGDYYEAPIIAYSGCSSKNVNLISCFGVPETIEDYFDEPYFYFTDYKNAVNMTNLKDDISSKLCIVRFALFPGNMGVITNRTNNNNDNTNVPQNDITKYDSAYVNAINGSPIWVLKKWEQQTSLTCHYVDMNSVDLNMDDEKEYYII